MTFHFAQSSFPEIYEQALVTPIFRPWVDELLDDVELAAGDRLLDIACGTGIVARVAMERLAGTGTVVGVDRSPLMLAVSRNVAPDIDWREGDASVLPLFDGEQFDVVVCQQGLQFFPDRPAAALEMRRALAADGRLAVSTWLPDDKFPLLLELRHVAERHVGTVVDKRHAFGDTTAVETVLSDAGFRDVRSKTVTRTIRFEDGSEFAEFNAIALVTFCAKAKNMSDEQRADVVAAIARDSADIVRRHTGEDGFAFELGANVTLARG